jgi:hypothetical protein
MGGKDRKVEMKCYRQKTIREAVRSWMSIRGFCRQYQLKESQFQWRQRKVEAGRERRAVRRPLAGRLPRNPLPRRAGLYPPK